MQNVSDLDLLRGDVVALENRLDSVYYRIDDLKFAFNLYVVLVLVCVFIITGAVCMSNHGAYKLRISAKNAVQVYKKILGKTKSKTNPTHDISVVSPDGNATPLV